MNPPTYAELVEALKACRTELAFCEWQLRGEGYKTGQSVTQALEQSKALLARAESAKLIGTYVWHDVREGLPDKCGWYVCAMEADEEVSELYFRDGGFPQATAYWAEPLQHPDALKGAE